MSIVALENLSVITQICLLLLSRLLLPPVFPLHARHTFRSDPAVPRLPVSFSFLFFFVFAFQFGRFYSRREASASSLDHVGLLTSPSKALLVSVTGFLTPGLSF